MKPHIKISTTCHPVASVTGQAAIVVADFPISAHETFRAVLDERQGKPIVSISRWKITPAGSRRAGPAFEFGAHRTNGMAKIIRELQCVLASLEIDGGSQ